MNTVPHSIDAPVLVTGAAGFIGMHLTRALLARGATVTATDTLPQPPSLQGDRLRFVQADLRSDAALPDLLRGVRTVYHLASAHLQANAPESLFREVNVDAAVRLVRAAGAAGVVRFVHTSTVGVYGHVAEPPAREDSPTAPGNRYERTKLEGEAAVWDAASRSDLQVVVLRPAWVYGPGCPRTEKLLRSVGRGRFFYVGAGRNLRHPIFIADAVDAFVQAGTAPGSVGGRTYNIAGPRHMELRDIVEAAAHVLGVKPPTRSVPRSVMLAAGAAAEIAWGVVGREPPFSRRSLAFFENDNAFDTSAAQADLGFVARVELEDGLRRTVERQAAAAAVDSGSTARTSPVNS